MKKVNKKHTYPSSFMGKFYELYLKGTENPVEFRKFKKMNITFFEYIMDKLVEGYIVPLPCGLGTLEVQGNRQETELVDGVPKKLAPDWVNTKKLWDRDPEAKRKKTLLYHLNTHTSGVIYKYFWSKRGVNIKNKELYSLRMSRANKRRLHKLIIEGKEY